MRLPRQRYICRSKYGCFCLSPKVTYLHTKIEGGSKIFISNFASLSWRIAAAVSEPEANERGSSLISRRLHYRGLRSLFLTKRKELCLCANGRFRMRSGMRKELWLCANGNILGCAVIWRKELWLCTNG